MARGEADKVSPEHRSLARNWLNRLDEIVDARFFEDMQEELEANDRDERQRIRNKWLMNDNKDGVVDHARQILADAMDSLPCPEIERYKAPVAAEGLFEGEYAGTRDCRHCSRRKERTMTTSAPDVGTSGVEGQDGRRSTWGDIATKFAWQMAKEGFRRGDLAELRRMDPDSVDSPVLMGLLAEKDLFRGSEAEKKWALILHGIALMTPTGGDDGEHRTAHNGEMPVGRALYLGSEATREQGFYSETRLKRLLTSRGGMTRTLLARAFRMLAAANVTFSWREMANFIRNDGFNEEAAERHRRRIARDYFQAQRRFQPDTTENE